MSSQEQLISSTKNLIDIMSKQNEWQVSQINGHIYLIDDQDNQYNIATFKKELVNRIYYANQIFLRQVENTQKDVKYKVFNQQKYSTINLIILFANQLKNLELQNNLQNNEDFLAQIQNPYKKQSLEFTFQGNLENLQFILQDDLKMKLRQLDRDINRFGGQIHVDTIQIQPPEYNSLNDQINLIIEQDLAFELKKIKFDNLLFNCYFNKSSYQKTNEQIIQINLNLSQNINMLKIQVSGRQKIDFKQKNEVKFIIPVLEIQFVSLQRKSQTVDISCIVNQDSPFSTYRITNANKDYQLIIFIAEEIDNQRVMELKRIRDNFNQAKLQLHAFYKYIEEYLLFHPDQHRYDLYECYDQLIC